MYKYTKFITEKRFNDWEKQFDTLNEGQEFSHLIDSISHFLEIEYEKGIDKFTKVIETLFNRFKHKIGMISLIASILLGSYMTITKISDILDKSGFNKSEKEIILKKADYKKPNETKKFLNAIAKSESSKPTDINQFGYIGKYQFGKMALIDLKLDTKIDADKFRKNPKIFSEKAQDRAMVKLLKINKQYLGDYIKKYEGKVISGVKITKSGLLAGSHLVGASDVKKFLDSNGTIIPKDGNNVPVTHYIKKFGGYQISI
jgi:hypothetical protein